MPPTAEVAFTVDLPFDTPETDSIYVSGDFNGWNPVGIPLGWDESGFATWRINVQMGTRFEYKYTRGAWERRACAWNGSDVGNGCLEAMESGVRREQGGIPTIQPLGTCAAFSDQVEAWADIPAPRTVDCDTPRLPARSATPVAWPVRTGVALGSVLPSLFFSILILLAFNGAISEITPTSGVVFPLIVPLLLLVFFPRRRMRSWHLWRLSQGLSLLVLGAGEIVFVAILAPANWPAGVVAAVVAIGTAACLLGLALLAFRDKLNERIAFLLQMATWASPSRRTAAEVSTVQAEAVAQLAELAATVGNRRLKTSPDGLTGEYCEGATCGEIVLRCLFQVIQAQSALDSTRLLAFEAWRVLEKAGVRANVQVQVQTPSGSRSETLDTSTYVNHQAPAVRLRAAALLAGDARQVLRKTQFDDVKELMLRTIAERSSTPASDLALEILHEKMSVQRVIEFLGRQGRAGCRLRSRVLRQVVDEALREAEDHNVYGRPKSQSFTGAGKEALAVLVDGGSERDIDYVANKVYLIKDWFIYSGLSPAASEAIKKSTHARAALWAALWGENVTKVRELIGLHPEWAPFVSGMATWGYDSDESPSALIWAIETAREACSSEPARG